MKATSSTVVIKKIGGHIDLHGNELADAQAKQAAKEAAILPTESTIKDISNLRSLLKNSVNKHWQTSWDRSNSGSWSHNLMPKVAQAALCVKIPRKAEVTLSRLIIGHNKLKERLHRIFPDFYPDSTCACLKGPETAEHILLHCPRFSQQRDLLVEEVERAFSVTELAYYKRTFNTSTVLVPKDMPLKTRCLILQATSNFIVSIGLDC